MAEGFCMRCKAKVEIKDGKEIEVNGRGGKKRLLMKGVCPVCGTVVCRIMGIKK